jgi:hypothetical protein
LIYRLGEVGTCVCWWGGYRRLTWAHFVVPPPFREVGGRGSHRVFAHPDVAELVNLQVERGQAKRYQVRQVVGLVRRYNLSLEEER